MFTFPLTGRTGGTIGEEQRTLPAYGNMSRRHERKSTPCSSRNFGVVSVDIDLVKALRYTYRLEY